MKKVDASFLDKIDDDSYIWYACYGSNINLERLMVYINGDASRKHANLYGCKDKSKPIDSKPYIIKRKLYFANHSQGWDGGVAFLNYRARGMTYGKIYKLKKSQFLDIYKQEHRLKDYDTVIYIGKYKRAPIFAFTSLYKLNNIEKPSKEYLDVIKKGIKQTYKNKTKNKSISIYQESQIDRYFLIKLKEVLKSFTYSNGVLVYLERHMIPIFATDNINTIWYTLVKEAVIMIKVGLLCIFW